MKPAAFQYHRAHSVAQAVDLLAELGEDAKIIAGGQSLVAMMNFRLARPTSLIDVSGITDLRYVDRDQTLTIGALTTHYDIERTFKPVLSEGYAVISDAMQWVGHLPIRTRGTIGGSIAHADATAEWCLLTVLLDAEIVVASTRGERTIAASEFFFGLYTTALEYDEMIVAVRFPRPAPHAVLTEYAQRHGDFAVVAVAADLDVTDGEVVSGRVALGGVSPIPIVSATARAFLDSAGPMTVDLAERCATDTVSALEFDEVDAPGGTDYLRGLTHHLLVTALLRAAAHESVAA
ncbi:FAD binding domain-containing protein [Mycobacterium sp. 21AC1]|uniref:FAD binding domain-containing protein n=1 Tax=[Mycobacterium] appelbergii TaxID=2939269 RepID=UPI002938D1B5|nr:FAD binding domain-containing protein [Mycobacterium sp. 21AC1]MDV3130164.1 FAD binding domain-containing protein [Mycobacterium sp. 21AC1]